MLAQIYAAPTWSADAKAEYQPLRIAPEQVDRLEREIDVMNKELQDLAQLYPARR